MLITTAACVAKQILIEQQASLAFSPIKMQFLTILFSAIALQALSVTSVAVERAELERRDQVGACKPC